MRPDEYVEHDATALAGLVRDGEVTAAELLAAGPRSARRGQPAAQRGRAQHRRRCRRPGGRSRPRRPLRRGAVPDQGPRPGVRRAPHHQRLPRAAARGRRPARAGHPALPRRGPGRLRQDEHPRARRQGRDRVRAARSGSQPVEHRPHAGRLLGRIGRRRGRRHRARCGRQRRWRVGAHPGGVQRPGRPQAQPRPRAVRSADRRGDVRHGDPGRRVADRARQRGAARRDHRARPAAPTTRAPGHDVPFVEQIRSAPARCGSAGPPPRRSTPLPTPRRSRRSRAPRRCSPSSGTRSRR